MRKLKALLIASMVATSVISSFAQSITLVTGEWAPYTGEKIASQGVCVAIVKAASKAGGLTENIKFCPWTRCEVMVKNGEAFAAFPYQMTDERKAKYAFSEPIIVAKSKVFYRSGVGKEIEWSTLKDLQKFKMGGVNGYWYIEAFERNGIKAEMANSSDLAFRMLESGRFEYLIENELVGKETIKNLFPDKVDQFKTLAKHYDESPFALMVSRSYPNYEEVLKKFNAGLDVIRNDGSYDSILKKHGL